MNKLFSIITLVLVLIINSCKTDSKSLLPAVTGQMSEVVLVIEDALWESSAGEAFKTALTFDIEGLPQSEPTFDIVHIPSKAFTKIIQSHRNIVITKVIDDAEPEMTVQKDVWAGPQIVFKMTAPDKDSLISLLLQNKDKMVRLIKETEIQRLIDLNKNNQEEVVTKYLKEKHKINLVVPKGYAISRKEEDFAWFTYEPRNVDLGLVVYYYNYTDTNTFTNEYLIAKRDSFMAKFIEGETPGTFMTTEKKLPVYSKEINLNGKYAYEMRGLWYLENDFMGGPFVSITTIDEVNNRVVTVEGFIYSPKLDKRFYLHKMESIIYSLSLNN